LRSIEKAIHLPSGEKRAQTVARRVGGDALDVRAGVVGSPDVAEVSESDAAVVVAGVAHASGFASVGQAGCARRSASIAVRVENILM
jgi:hypothetical protein